jgi:hypothetical protein
MDRMQIILGLALNVLEIPIDLTHYREICNVTYMAKCVGLYIRPARIELPAKTNQARSIRSHEYGGQPSRSLIDDVEDMHREIAGDTDLGYDSFRGWCLTDDNIAKLLTLKPHIGETIPQEFLDTHPEPKY